jgi:hypothetical protein
MELLFALSTRGNCYECTVTILQSAQHLDKDHTNSTFAYDKVRRPPALSQVQRSVDVEVKLAHIMTEWSMLKAITWFECNHSSILYSHHLAIQESRCHNHPKR